MKCFYHPKKDAVAMCEQCNKGLCQECASKWDTTLCDDCANILNKSVKQQHIKTLVIAGVLFFIGLIIADSSGYGMQSIVLAYCIAGIPFGWNALTKITPSMFIFMPLIGWLFYICAKLSLAFMVGAFVLPFRLYKAIKEIIEIKGVDLKTLGNISTISTITLVGGLVGLFGSWISSLSSLAFVISVFALIIGIIGLYVAYNQKTPKEYIAIAISIAIIGVVVSYFQFASNKPKGDVVSLMVKKDKKNIHFQKETSSQKKEKQITQYKKSDIETIKEIRNQRPYEYEGNLNEVDKQIKAYESFADQFPRSKYTTEALLNIVWHNLYAVQCLESKSLREERVYLAIKNCERILENRESQEWNREIKELHELLKKNNKNIIKGDYSLLSKAMSSSRNLLKKNSEEGKIDKSIEEINKEEGETFLNENSNEPGFKITDNGLQHKIILRSDYNTIKPDDLISMFKQYGFFYKNRNLLKTFKNQFERKIISGDSVVIDHSTGLMWQQGGSATQMDFEDAKNWIINLNNKVFAGYNDWRLPSIEEGASLLESDNVNGNLHIDDVFSGIQSWIWTGDKFSSYTMWIVDFDIGRANSSLLTSGSIYVRAVRLVQ